MIDEINSTELHTCLLEITLLPLAHYWQFWYGPLDVDAMRQAASYLVGTHDFKSFATAKPEVTDTVRTIYETSLEKEDDLIRFRITGNGFLYNMVRIITGTQIEVG